MLEGPDAAGKTTQRRALEALAWRPPGPAIAHMPSGATHVGRAVYDLTERGPVDSPLARQLLHLAAHAENLPVLRAERAARGIILDRWWWSTVAYGWFAGGLRGQLAEDAFFGAIQMVWRGFSADLVLVFSPLADKDAGPVRNVIQGYEWLAEHHKGSVVRVPPGTVDATTGFLVEQLRLAGIVST